MSVREKPGRAMQNIKALAHAIAYILAHEDSHAHDLAHALRKCKRVVFM